jgi:hypothetical protein
MTDWDNSDETTPFKPASKSRLAVWAHAINAPVYELRRRGEVVETWERSGKEISKDDAEELVRQFETAATWDCDEEGKPTTYQLVGVLDSGEYERCPITIRRRPNQDSKYVDTVVKQNTELHKMVVDTFKTMQKDLRDAVTELRKENRALENDRKETFRLLEDLRSKQLERDLMREKHDKELETKDRLLDAGLPVLAAIGAKLTKQNLLQAPDARVNAIKQIAKGMSEKQVDMIAEILPDDETRERVGRLLARAVDGAIDPDEFIKEIRALKPETLVALRSVLNTGQALAVQTLLEAS